MKTNYFLTKENTKKLLFLSLLLIFMSGSLLIKAQYNGQEYLRIGDVRSTWSTNPGSIDSVTFEVKPQGLYTEIGMYLDFSVRGTTYSSLKDSLEIQMLFQLPKNAEVTDMWLWVGDSVVKAGVYDKWKASQIYESIVHRRTDPAILYKYAYYNYEYYGGNYELIYSDLYMFRIFPLVCNLPRKAKITYLIPSIDLNMQSQIINLPINILKLSNLAISSTIIKFYSKFGLTNPRIVENNNLVFNLQTDTINGNYYMAKINEANSMGSLTLSLDCNSVSEIFSGKYNSVNNDKYYQLQIFPSKLFGLQKSKKVLFLIDFIDANSNGFTGIQLIQQLKMQIKNKLTPKDSFNIMISGMFTHNISNEWIACDSAGLEAAFNSFSANDFNNYSNLPGLLMDGITYINERNHDGVIALITSSNSYGSNTVANDLITDYLQMMGEHEIPIHIIDLDDINNWNEAQYIGGHVYYGNEYFYNILSLQTVGEYMSLKEMTFPDIMNNLFNKISGYISNFDLYVTLDNGYTFANYNYTRNASITYYDQPFKRIGKFIGSGRFHIIASAQLPTGEFYHSDFYIDNEQTYTLDSTTQAVWATQLVHELYGYNQSNSIVSEIINLSIEKRVLTKYTAFLALEPGMGDLNGVVNGNGNNSITVEKVPDTKTKIEIFPNPATDYVIFNITLNKSSKIRIELYDVIGRLVSVIYEKETDKGVQNIKCNLNELKSGTYLYKILSDEVILQAEKICIVN